MTEFERHTRSRNLRKCYEKAREQKKTREPRQEIALKCKCENEEYCGLCNPKRVLLDDEAEAGYDRLHFGIG